LNAILVTHGHSDHIKGLAALLKTTGACIYANRDTVREAGLDADSERVRLFVTGGQFGIGDLQVQTFAVSHDTMDPAGFSFMRGGRQLSIVTDTGIVTPTVQDRIREADILVLESNHDENILRMGRYPWFLKQRILGEKGHLSNEAAALALAEALEEDRREGVRREKTVLLAHLSKENNFPEMAMATMTNILEERGVLRAGLKIETLPRSERSGIFTV